MHLVCGSAKQLGSAQLLGALDTEEVISSRHTVWTVVGLYLDLRPLAGAVSGVWHGTTHRHDVGPSSQV